jgi:hypothetical protein
MDVWKFWSVVAVCVGLMWGLAWWLKKRRGAALQAAAEELKFEFEPEGDRSLVHRLAGFDLTSCYRSFGNTPIRNVLRREANGREITIFDYRMRKQHSDDSPTTMTLLLLESEELDLPAFVARPESLFQKLGSVLGGADINFPEHPEFSRKYLLRGEDEEQIRQLMTDEVIRAFERHTGIGITGISVEGRGRRLLVYRFLRTICASELPEFLAAGLEIAEPMADSSISRN